MELETSTFDQEDTSELLTSNTSKKFDHKRKMKKQDDSNIKIASEKEAISFLIANE